MEDLRLVVGRIQQLTEELKQLGAVAKSSDQDAEVLPAVEGLSLEMTPIKLRCPECGTELDKAGAKVEALTFECPDCRGQWALVLYKIKGGLEGGSGVDARAD